MRETSEASSCEQRTTASHEGGVRRVAALGALKPTAIARDSRRLDAVVRADPSIILGLAAGMLDLHQVLGLIEIDGDEDAARALFGAERADAGAPARQ